MKMMLVIENTAVPAPDVQHPLYAKSNGNMTHVSVCPTALRGTSAAKQPGYLVHASARRSNMHAVEASTAIDC